MRTVTFEYKGQRHSIAIPPDELSGLCIKDIVEGHSYPFAGFLRPAQVVVDIGGHAGEFAVICKINWPQAEVHCYEPNYELMPYLKHNASIYDFLIKPQAVGILDGSARLHRSGFGSVANSLVTRPNQTGDGFEVDVVGAGRVMGLKPNVLKIDAEGMEWPILCAADGFTDGEWTLQDVDVIYVEFHQPGDRLLIDGLLTTTHDLWFSRQNHMDQGELTYIRRNYRGKTDMQ